MDTLHRPDILKPAIGCLEILADAVLGFAVFWVGAIVALADMRRKDDDLEEAFFRIIQP